MKNYVSPKSVVLSMNMNENIAASYSYAQEGLYYNTTGEFWATSQIKIAEYPIRLIGVLSIENKAVYDQIMAECDKAPEN